MPQSPLPVLSRVALAPSRSRPVLSLALAGALLTGAVHAEPTFFGARVAPILDRHCVTCHGPDKAEAELRLDSFELTMAGSDAGEVVMPGQTKDSELYRRITLPPDHEEFMPAEGKPPLSPEEVKILELWIAGGASPQAPLSAFPDAPALRPLRPVVVPLTEDWRPLRPQIAALERELGCRLVPQSQIPTDGLILRTASAPGRCNDEMLARLQPVAAYIVAAELARTQVTDEGLRTLAGWQNLRALDLTRTRVTSAGLAELSAAAKLEALNLTDTAVDDAGLAHLQRLPALQRVWVFGTRVSAAEENPVRLVAGEPRRDD